MVRVRPMEFTDIASIARIHRDSFPDDTDSLIGSRTWIHSKFLGWPVNTYFVAESDSELVGYILWVEMGGFRKNVVLELEQVAVSDNHRSQGIGSRLIDDSIEEMARRFAEKGRVLKLVEVTTATSNNAQKLYKKTLGAMVECIKNDFFDQDEAVIIARRSSINYIRKKRNRKPIL